MDDFLASLDDLHSPLPVALLPLGEGDLGDPELPQREGFLLPPELAGLAEDEFEPFRAPRLVAGAYVPAGGICGWRLTGKGRARAEAARAAR